MRRRVRAQTTGSLPAVGSDPKLLRESERKAQRKAMRKAMRSRRRFARRQWRRRWLAWRYLVVLVVFIALAAGVIYALRFSSLLAVNGVEVSGTQTLTSQRVRTAARVPMGKPLIEVDLDAIHRRVAALAPVASVDVTRKWPDEISIRISERVPVAVVSIAGHLHALDKDGVVFLTASQVPKGLPEIATPEGTSQSALREAASVVSSLDPEVAKLVDHVEVKTVDQISLALKGGRTVIWGSAADSTTKATVLKALLKQKAQTYDVSVPGQPTTSG